MNLNLNRILQTMAASAMALRCARKESEVMGAPAASTSTTCLPASSTGGISSV